MSYSQRTEPKPHRTPRALGASLAALLAAALIGAGCSGDDGGASTNAGQAQALEFAQCMRDNGVDEFPDPDASGELTIDGVVNGSSLDPDGPEWQQAMGACEDLQPPGFFGDQDVSDAEQQLRLEFAQCMRDQGVADFPDPARGDPLVDTRKIPSAANGLDAINAAMDACGDIAEKAMGQ
jgi:hypothetical protein